MNSNKTTVLLIAAAVLLVGSGLYYFFRAAPEPPPAPVVEQQETGDEIQYLGTTLSETKDGKLQWELKADQIQAGAGGKAVSLVGLHAQIYDVSGQGHIQLTANQGGMDMQNRIVTIQGNIRAISDKGAELAGDMIKWFMKERRFTGEGNIQYRQKNITIMGENLEADQNLETIRVTGNARAELRR